MTATLDDVVNELQEIKLLLAQNYKDSKIDNIKDAKLKAIIDKVKL